MLLRAEGETVYVNTSIWGTSVVLEWLYQVKVGTLTLREAILSVKLNLSGNNRVLSPAVHVECSLGKNEDASIGKTVGDGTGDALGDHLLVLLDGVPTGLVEWINFREVLANLLGVE